MVSTSNFGNVSVFDEVDQLGQFRAFHSSSSQLTKITITPRPHVAIAFHSQGVCLSSTTIYICDLIPLKGLDQSGHIEVFNISVTQPSTASLSPGVQSSFLSNGSTVGVPTGHIYHILPRQSCYQCRLIN